MLTKKMSHIIQLFKDNCPPDEAAELIETLVGDQKIVEMKAQKKNVRALLAEAKEMGYNVEVSANIDVRLVKKPFSHDVPLSLTNN